MKALRIRADAAKASAAGMFMLLMTILLLGQSSAIFLSVLLVPFIAGHAFVTTTRKAEVLDKAFWFMVFNLPFGFLLLISGVYYLDVVFPVLYFYILSSPLMFSIGCLIRNRRLFVSVLLLLIFLAAVLHGYRSHLTIVLTGFLKRNFYEIFRLFIPYNAFLLLYQILKVWRRQRWV